MNFPKLKQVDRTLLVTVVILAIFGLIMLSSASVAVGLSRFGDANFYIKRQLLWLVIGLLAAWYVYGREVRFWQEKSWLFFVISLVLLVLVLIPGIGAGGKGAQRWLNLYWFSVQPSEIVKLTLILYLSAWLTERGHRAVQNFRSGVLPLFGLLAFLFLLIIKQPDLGTLIVVAGIGLALYFTGGAHPKHMLALLAVGTMLVGISVAVAPYRLARITTFLNPAADPQGAGYHINQAKIAIGSGGLLGLGLGHSRQKFLYLPEAANDSIFAVIAEELGFVFSVLLVVLFLLFLWRGLVIARRAPDGFSRLTAVGITIWIAGQSFINIGALVGVLPLTGIPLPFVSSGGSALVMNLIGVAILLKISSYENTSGRRGHAWFG